MQTLEQYEPFVINECGVVLNPILVGVQYSKYGFISCAIAVGEIDGLWYAGYTYEDDNNQGGELRRYALPNTKGHTKRRPMPCLRRSRVSSTGT